MPPKLINLMVCVAIVFLVMLLVAFCANIISIFGRVWP